MRLVPVVLAFCIALYAADGPFKGKWSSSRNSVGGDIQIVLESGGAVTFTIEGQEVKTTVASCDVSGNSGEDRKFSIEYKFTLGDTTLISYATGTIKDGRIEGKYETKTGEQRTVVDEGTFTGTAETAKKQ